MGELMSVVNRLKKFMSKIPEDAATNEAFNVAYSKVLLAISPKS
jgi:hypothetical protein